MRLLSTLEKQICRKIQADKGNYIQNILDSDLEGLLIFIDYSNSKVELQFPRNDLIPTDEESQVIIDRINQLVHLIVITVNFVQMMEKEGYILAYKRATTADDFSQFGRGITNRKHLITHSLPDPQVAEMLLEYTRKEIYPTPEFQRFCDRGFIAREEQRFLRQLRMTYVAISVALLAAFGNIGLNIYNASTRKIMTIDSAQAQPVMDHLRNLNTQLDSLNHVMHNFGSRLITHDSLVRISRANPGKKNKKTI